MVRYLKEKTIQIDGKEVVFADPLMLTGWKDTLTYLPPIGSLQVLLYLMNKRAWTQERLNGLENERGYQLHKDNHIQNVKCKADGDFFYIKADCIRQTSLKETPYVVWLLATSRGSIESSGCQCTG